jgi:hypothetical protein
VHLGLDQFFVLCGIRVTAAGHAADVLLADTVLVRLLHIAIDPVIYERAATSLTWFAIRAHGACKT